MVISSKITILSNHIHLWYIPYDISRIDKACLIEDELERANAFKFEIHRNQFLMYHTALRRILSAYHDTAPQNLVISCNKYGKPYLVHNSFKLQFNLSHSNNMAILAVTTKYPIGVDIEQIKSLENLESLVKRFFSKEEQNMLFLLPSDKRLIAFYEIWTRKEAYIKAIGKGLSFPLDHFTVSFSDNYPPRIISVKSEIQEAKYWSMHCFSYYNNGEKYEAACTVRNKISKILRYEYVFDLYNKTLIHNSII